MDQDVRKENSWKKYGLSYWPGRQKGIFPGLFVIAGGIGITVLLQYVPLSVLLPLQLTPEIPYTPVEAQLSN